MRLRSFCNELSRMFQGSVRVNRGKMSLTSLAEKAIEEGADRVVVVEEWQGNPAKLLFFTLAESGLSQTPPTIIIRSVKLQRDFGTRKERIGKAIGVALLDVSSGAEGQKLASALSRFLHIPIYTQADTAMLRGRNALAVMVDHSTRIRLCFASFLRMTEIGPSITVSKLIWEV